MSQSWPGYEYGDTDFDLGIPKRMHSKDPSRSGIAMEFSRMGGGYSSFGAGYGRNLQPSEKVDRRLCKLEYLCSSILNLPDDYSHLTWTTLP